MHTDNHIANQSAADEFASYQIHSRVEIGSILQSISQQRQLLEMIIQSGAQSGMTSILQVDTMRDTVVVELSSNAVVNRRIADGGPVRFESRLDNIRISFDAVRVEECLFDGNLALVFAFPATLMRLQRREYYRITTPRATPVKCAIHIQDHDEKADIYLPLFNVSCGGVAIMDEDALLDATIGRIYHNCRIGLADNTFVVVSLQVRNVHTVSRKNHKPVRKIGCRFVELPRTMLAIVQRYIAALEHEHSAKGLRS